MTVERTQNPPPMPSGRAPTTAEIIDRLSRFEGPPEQFLVNLLAVQCRLAGAAAGVILRSTEDGRPELLAVFPPLAEGATAPAWLAEAVEAAGEVIAGGTTQIKPLHGAEELYGQPARRNIIMLPLRGGTGARGLAAFHIASDDPAVLAASRERIELTSSLLGLYEMRLTLQRSRVDMRRMRTAMEALSAVNEHDRFAGCAMTLCNEVASRWQCERTSVGFLKGRYVRLKATSHTEKFSRKMELVQHIEAAMEECLDQNLEVLCPVAAEAGAVTRATEELARRHGPSTVLSLPMRREGEPVAVLTLERQVDRPFVPEEIEALRLTCELCTPRLANLYEHDRWFGAKAAGAARKGLAALVGPKHTWLKIAAILVLGAAVFLTFAQGQYRAGASFVVEPIEKRILSAPFEGYLKSVEVEVGDPVRAGQVLGQMETTDLDSQLAQAEFDLKVIEKQRSTAMAEGKTADAMIAEAQADKVREQVRFLKLQLRRAQITSPIGGTVAKGESKRQVSPKVKEGAVLFEVAPLEALRAELSLPEDELADVRGAFIRARARGEELTGELATARYPGQRIRFVVERINPIAEVADQKNVFKVRVRLAERPEWMAPGMEGVAKIDLGSRSYGWLWTHKIVNWIRMKLWW